MWTSDEFIGKAMIYGQKASDINIDETTRGLFLSITLEMLAKGLLARAHPSFIAAPKDIVEALKAAASDKPTNTLQMGQVLDRLALIHPELRHRLVDDLKQFINERNAEIHSSRSSFESLGEKRWLPLVVNGIAHMADLLEKPGNPFLGKELISRSGDFQNQNAKEREERVTQVINTVRGQWNRIPEDEKQALRAGVLPSEYNEQVVCPVCGSNLTLSVGLEPVSQEVLRREGEWDRLSVFEINRVRCKPCGFALNDPHELAVVGLPDEVTTYQTLDWDDLYDEGYYEEYGDE